MNWKPVIVGTLGSAIAVTIMVFCGIVLWPMWQDHHSAEQLRLALRSKHQSDFDAALDDAIKSRRPWATVPVLIEAMEDTDGIVRTRAAKSLGRVGHDARTAIHSLIEGLGDENGWVRKESGVALESMREAAVPALIQALRHPNPDARGMAAVTLGNLGPAAEDAVPALVAVIQDTNEEPNIRTNAAMAVRGFAPSEILPDLIELLKCEDGIVQYWVAESMRVYGTAAVDRLVDAARSESDPKHHAAFVHALWIARGDQPAISLLSESLKDESHEVRQMAAAALAVHGPQAESTLSQLGEALSDSHPMVRMMAARAIGKVDPAQSARAAEVLGSLLDEEDRIVGECSLHYLLELGAEAVPYLIKAARSSNRNIQEPAIFQLGQYGADAASAVPVLTELTEHDDRAVRQTAAEAIQRITADSSGPDQ